MTTPNTQPAASERALSLREALTEIAGSKNLTATAAQFVRYLQNIAADALVAPAPAGPVADCGPNPVTWTDGDVVRLDLALNKMYGTPAPAGPVLTWQERLGLRPDFQEPKEGWPSSTLAMLGEIADLRNQLHIALETSTRQNIAASKVMRENLDLSAALAAQLPRIRHLEHERDTARRDCDAVQQAPDVARDATLEDAACLVAAGCGFSWNEIAKSIRAMKSVAIAQEKGK